MAEAERVKPRSLYVEEAIQAALESRWQEALSINHALMDRHGPDEDAFNRIGKAQTELGDLNAALEAYTRALELNPLNLIAQKNTRKIATLLETATPIQKKSAPIDVDLFTEEPGKSSIAVLSSPKRAVSVTIAPGDVVELDVTEGRLEARTGRGVLLGDVDVKLARRLIALMETGNRYTAAVARIGDDRIEIMIREDFQSTANVGKPSFPVARSARGAEFRPYAKDSLLAQRGIDAEALDAADDDDEGDVVDVEDAGMQTTEDFDDDTAVLAGTTEDDEEEEEEEPPDDGTRPEDSY